MSGALNYMRIAYKALNEVPFDDRTLTTNHIHLRVFLSEIDQAAEQLVRARAIDPNQVLTLDNGVRLTYDQLASRILYREGKVAIHLYFAQLRAGEDELEAKKALERAKAALIKAAQFDRYFKEPHRDLAQVHLILGDKRAALASADAALLLNQDDDRSIEIRDQILGPNLSPPAPRKPLISQGTKDFLKYFFGHVLKP